MPEISAGHHSKRASAVLQMRLGLGRGHTHADWQCSAPLSRRRLKSRGVNQQLYGNFPLASPCSLFCPPSFPAYGQQRHSAGVFLSGDIMATLSTKKRNALPKSAFAGADRSYPVDTHNRAANAKARASQQYNAGNLSKSAMQKIDAKANAVLKKKK